jgi:hypothetical protein
MPPQINQKLAWTLVLAIELGGFLITRLVLHRRASELAIPYLVTFVLPLPVVLLATRGLLKWETQRPPPRLLAFWWGLTIGFIPASVNGFIFYYGHALLIFSPEDSAFTFSIAWAAFGGVAMSFYVAYSQLLPKIIARRDQRPPGALDL